MLVAEFLTALLFAVLFVAVFAIAFDRRGPWSGIGWFFLIVLLGAWAVGVWAEPVGPLLWGAAWVPILFGALFIALLVAAIPPTPTRPVEVTEPETAGAAAAVGLFFWLLLLLLLVAIVIAYV